MEERKKLVEFTKKIRSSTSSTTPAVEVLSFLETLHPFYITREITIMMLYLETNQDEQVPNLYLYSELTKVLRS